MGKTFEQWIDYYNSKVKIPFSMEDGAQFECLAEKGFLAWFELPEPGLMCISAVCGDGLFWVSRAKEIAKDRGLKTIVGTSTLNPKAVEAYLGFKVIGYVFSQEV